MCPLCSYGKSVVVCPGAAAAGVGGEVDGVGQEHMQGE